MAERRCRALNLHGEPCRAAPLIDGPYCFMHSPEHAEHVSEARRLGGVRRRREATIRGAYDIQGVGAYEDRLRLVEIAITDTLGLENSVSRNRAIVYLVTNFASLQEREERQRTLRKFEAVADVLLERTREQDDK